MNCPSCSQPASTFKRFAFSMQGVSTFKSIQGYLTCQHCGKLLHVSRYSNKFWFILSVIVILLALFLVFYRFLILNFGIGGTAVVWVVLAFLILYLFTYGLWKYAQIHMADHDKQPVANPSN